MLKRLMERFGRRDKKKDLKLFSSGPQIVKSTSQKVKYRGARDLLKEATQLKKEKRYEEACNKLKEVYSAQDAGDLMLKERLRLPMYLQLAGKNDEGWHILNEMNIKYSDVFSQAEIANQMRVFLQKEKKDQQAILFDVWAICKEVERDRSNIERCIKMADEMAKLHDEYDFLGELSDKRDVIANTPQGNPITDSAYVMFNERIETSIVPDGVRKRLTPLLKKAKLENKSEKLSVRVSSYLTSKKTYDLRAVRDLISDIINVE